MRLTKTQKDLLLAWVGEGLKLDEINGRAKKAKPPFAVTGPQVAHYRKTRGTDMAALVKQDETSALLQGLAKREARAAKLNALGEQLWADLEKTGLWLPMKKSIGNGPSAQVFEYKVFNAAGVEAFRMTLDDLAREVGDRKLVVVDDWQLELEKLGLNPETVFAAAVREIEAAMEKASNQGD